MFSGLNKFLKVVLPKRLFYRALIIVAAPTIILQLIITIVFYDSIWIKANKNITRSLISQLKTIQEQQSKLQGVLTDIGVIEVRKHEALHAQALITQEIEATKKQLKKLILDQFDIGHSTLEFEHVEEGDCKDR